MRSYLGAAERFLEMDHLEYARTALEQATQLAPNDLQTRLRHFKIGSQYVIRYTNRGAGVNPEASPLIPEGFMLLEEDLPAADRASVLVTLTQLFRIDPKWVENDRVLPMIEEAMALNPDNAQLVYDCGVWFISTKKEYFERGMQLIEQTTRMAPNNAGYWATLGREWLGKNRYRQALPLLRRSVELDPMEAIFNLKQLLIKADLQQDITSDDFLGLNPAERTELLGLAIKHMKPKKPFFYSSSECGVWWIAARWHRHLGETDQAKAALLNSFSDDPINGNRYISISDAGGEIRKAEMLAAILQEQGDPDGELEQLRTRIEEVRDHQKYQESWSIGSDHDGAHRYRTGIKVPRKGSTDGVLVVKTIEGYPFAKAGVLAGDRIVEFAGAGSFNSLRRSTDEGEGFVGSGGVAT